MRGENTWRGLAFVGGFPGEPGGSLGVGWGGFGIASIGCVRGLGIDILRKHGAYGEQVGMKRRQRYRDELRPEITPHQIARLEVTCLSDGSFRGGRD